MTMKYKFVKFQDSNQKGEFPWMLECEDIKLLIEHSEKYNGHLIRGFESLISNDYDESTQHGKAIQCIAKSEGTSIIVAAMSMENRVFQGKLRTINSCGKIFLRENGSYCINQSSFTIINTIIKDDIKYPNYTKSDIKVSQWKNGTHYYAKIGNMDIVNKNGNQKWNSYDEAYNEALKQL